MSLIIMHNTDLACVCVCVCVFVFYLYLSYHHELCVLIFGLSRLIMSLTIMHNTDLACSF